MTGTESLAAGLGLTEPVIRRLRARGHLTRLELSELEARERLWRAHVAFLSRNHRRPALWLAPSVRVSAVADDR
jgi:hypothetical protein